MAFPPTTKPFRIAVPAELDIAGDHYRSSASSNYFMQRFDVVNEEAELPSSGSCVPGTGLFGKFRSLEETAIALSDRILGRKKDGFPYIHIAMASQMPFFQGLVMGLGAGIVIDSEAAKQVVSLILRGADGNGGTAPTIDEQIGLMLDIAARVDPGFTTVGVSYRNEWSGYGPLIPQRVASYSDDARAYKELKDATASGDTAKKTKALETFIGYLSDSVLFRMKENAVKVLARVADRVPAASRAVDDLRRAISGRITGRESFNRLLVLLDTELAAARELVITGLQPFQDPVGGSAKPADGSQKAGTADTGHIDLLVRHIEQGDSLELHARALARIGMDGSDLRQRDLARKAAKAMKFHRDAWRSFISSVDNADGFRVFDDLSAMGVGWIAPLFKWYLSDNNRPPALRAAARHYYQIASRRWRRSQMEDDEIILSGQRQPVDFFKKIGNGDYYFILVRRADVEGMELRIGKGGVTKFDDDMVAAQGRVKVMTVGDRGRPYMRIVYSSNDSGFDSLISYFRVPVRAIVKRGELDFTQNL